MAEGEVLQFQCDAGAEGRPKNGEESWPDTHRKRVAARRVNSIISSSSEFPVGTLVFGEGSTELPYRNTVGACRGNGQ